MRKYNLSVAMREKVILILYALVYARKTIGFDMHKSKLAELLEDVSPKFLSYMDSRWYACRKMWSDCERARVFTALNTTSNRIESSWNQVKIFLRKKLRIDLCLESIFAYQTAVMRREYRLLNKYMERLILRSKADPFVQDALCEMAEYAANAVDQQWHAAKIHASGSREPYKSTRSGSEYTVWRSAPEASKYTVETTNGSCTCDFHVTSALPCRHMLHVAKHVMNLHVFPVTVIPSRWRVRDAFDMVPLLEQNANDIQTLRTSLLMSDVVFNELVQREYTGVPTYISPVPRRVTYFRLDRAERNELVVLINLEKRNIVDNAVAKIRKFLMQQNTPQFWRLAGQFDDLLESTLQKWTDEQAGLPLVEKDTTSDEDSTDEDDEYEEDCFGNECDRVIASAMASEEDAFYDADSEQRNQQLLRDRADINSVPFPCGTLSIRVHESCAAVDGILNDEDSSGSSHGGSVQLEDEHRPYESTSLCDSFEMADPPVVSQSFANRVVCSIVQQQILRGSVHYKVMSPPRGLLRTTTTSQPTEDCVSPPSHLLSSLMVDAGGGVNSVSSFTDSAFSSTQVSGIVDSIVKVEMMESIGIYSAQEVPARPPKRKVPLASPSINDLRDLARSDHGSRIGIETLQQR